MTSQLSNDKGEMGFEVILDPKMNGLSVPIF